MAGVVDPRFSALYGDASKWLEAAPDYDAVIAKVGATDGAGVLARSACMTTLLNLAVRSPTVVAFVLASDPDLIHVGHSCTRYPANISKPSAVDDQFVVLVGDREDSCEPIAIDDDGFSRGAATRCYSVDDLRGNQGHAATPAVLRRASPAGGTTGSTEEFSTYKLILNTRYFNRLQHNLAIFSRSKVYCSFYYYRSCSRTL